MENMSAAAFLPGSGWTVRYQKARLGLYLVNAIPILNGEPSQIGRGQEYNGVYAPLIIHSLIDILFWLQRASDKGTVILPLRH
jgi:hypothetical protein